MGWYGLHGVVWVAWGGMGCMGWYGLHGMVWVAWGYHNGVKWYQTSPLYSVVDETDDGEDGKDSKDNTSPPEVFVKVINIC